MTNKQFLKNATAEIKQGTMNTEEMLFDEKT